MKITLTKQAQKFLNKAERSDYKLYLRLKDAVDSIPELLRNHQGDIKQLVGEKGLYRLRVGNVRISAPIKLKKEVAVSRKLPW